MSNPAKFNKNNALSKIPAAFLRIFLATFMGVSSLLGLAGCSSSSSPDNRPTLNIDAPVVTEGAGSSVEVIFTITLSENAATDLTVDYATADDIATAADSDFTPTSGSVTIAAGTQTATISDVFVNGDDVFEVNETFNLVVSNPRGLDIQTTSLTGQATITNDDNADPEGYFSGTATLNGTNLTDLTGIMYNSRLMLFSPSQNVLFDITAFNTTVFDYNATVDVYEAGVLTQTDIRLDGTTDEAFISGAFSGGADLAAGSFNIVYDINNNIGATLPRIETVRLDRWTGDIFGVDNDPTGTFISDNTGVYSVLDFTTPSCVSTIDAKLFIPDLLLNIYEMAHDVIQNSECEYISAGHTGFVSVLSINDVDTLVFAYSNGANGGTTSLFGILIK